MEKFPEVHINRPADSDSLLSEHKPQSPEPEVEECCEDNQVREIIADMGIDLETITHLKSIRHTPSESSCAHCKLVDKVKFLREGIQKLNYEIETTEEILKTKRVQNKDIKNVIDKIEGTIETTEISTDKYKEGEVSNPGNCTCTKQCRIM